MENFSSIYVLESNSDSRELLQAYINEFGLNSNVKSYADFELGVNEILQDTTIPIVIIDLDNEENFIENLIKKIKILTPKIIATSKNYCTDKIIQALRLGVCDFIPKPVLKDDLYKSIQKLSKQNLEEDTSSSKIITIYSNKGGIGKTTIATNFAYELAKVTRDKVALIDLNLQLGDVSTFLNLNPSFDVAYVINNLIDKNSEILLNAFERIENTKLYVLSDPNFIEQSESIKPQQVEKLFEVLKKAFTYIVIDMSSNIDEKSLKILDKSDFIFFTTIVNIPAIRNAQRCLNLFESRNYEKEKVKILINRFMENDELSIQDIENTLGKSIYWKIPNNYFSIMEAINRGIPIAQVNATSNIAHSFKDLAQKVSDEIIEKTLLKYRG